MTILRDEKTGKFLKGNKSGGRKGYHLAELLREEGSIPDTLLPHRTRLERVIKTLYDDAIGGDMKAIEIIFNRLYGKEADILKLAVEEQLDLSKLSDEELAEYNELLGKISDESDEA